MAYVLRGLYDRLREDSWRKNPENAFSADLGLVNDVFFHPYSTRGQKIEALAKWLQQRQPCLFGRVAAAKDWLHYCILTEQEILRDSDEQISQKIREEWLAWQRRSLRPTADFSVPAHGFVLLVVSERVA